MLYDGKVSGDTISISFMNKGKIPLRHFVFFCAPPPRKRQRHYDCHIEAGIFFPGIP
jgi:hypothetical protein